MNSQPFINSPISTPELQECYLADLCPTAHIRVKSADVVYEFFRIVGDRLAGIGSGTGLGVVGH